VLCLTNVYGPRMALRVEGQGFLGGFLRRALCGQRLEVFGDGRQLRDPVYVDDAVYAFLAAGAAENPPHRLWNAGGSEALSLGEIATAMSLAAEVPLPLLRPFPPELRTIDIGSYTTDSNRILADLGWRPQVRFAAGIARSLEFFRREWPHYLPDMPPPLPAGPFQPETPDSRGIAV